MRAALRRLEAAGYSATVALCAPINYVLSKLLASRVRPGAVLHVSAMVHIAAHTTRILREHGVNASYLAVGHSPWWSEADYHFRSTRLPVLSVLKEMWWVWRVVARHEIVHSHFMVTVSRNGWEWPLLAAMGRKLVIHYRGCEIRDRERNMALHPHINICQECDYRPYICKHPFNVHQRPRAARYGAAFIVTTPDMKDFAPDARHLPFFVTRPDPPSQRAGARRDRVKIVHATNHPGIEGSAQIRRAIDALIGRGHRIDYVELRGVTPDRVAAELADADLSIGKMKMGYYANLQIESLAAGVPAITWVRPELMTDAIRDSGLIIASLDRLQEVLEYYLTHREALEQKQAIARSSVFQLHDNTAIAADYKALYAGLASPHRNPS
jgi:hypothetical protein